MKRHKWLIGGIIILVLPILLIGCVSKSEYEILDSDYNTLQDEYETLRIDYASLLNEKISIEEELENTQAQLKDFQTVTEFKDWISGHIQPETKYIEDAFLAAYKVQQCGIADGYLMGIGIDIVDDYSYTVVITTFVGDELYFWYVEDIDIYGSYGFRR